MKTKVTRSSMFMISLSVNEEILRALKNSPEIAAEGMQLAADYWHENFLGRHFQKFSGAKYGYALRNSQYKKQARKKGKPDLVLSGSLQRDLESRAAIRKTSRSVELKMHARVLNFVPNIQQSNIAMRVRHSNGNMYPNIKREVKVMVSPERAKLSDICSRYMVKTYMASKK